MEQELQNQIDELKQTTEDLSNQLEISNQRLQDIDPVNLLSLNLDVASQRTITSVIEKSIDDIVWNKYFYYSTFIESIARYFQETGVGGAIGLNANGLSLAVSNTTDDYASVSLDILDLVADSDILRFDKETKFRTQLKIDVVDGADLSIGGVGTLLHNIQFLIEDGTIKAFTSNNSSSTTVNIGSVADDTYVKLEYRYYPKSRADFYINDILVKSISTTLPLTTVGTDNVFNASLVKNSGTAGEKEAFIMFYDIIQRK